MSSAAPPITKQEAAASTATLSARPSLFGDYAQLFKVRVTSLVVMTAWTGYYLGAVRSGVPSLALGLLHALVGIGLTSAGAAALNEAMEHRVDALMARTRNRPIPARRMTVASGLIAGAVAAVTVPVYLALTANILTGVLAFLTAAAYLGLYTPLKKISPISTFVGAFPGAMPPLLGWTAIRGRLEWEGIVLFTIVFLWQFPHFQAIAWLYREDYAAGGIKMLPVVDRAGHSVVRQILAYSSVLIPVSLLPTGLHMAGKTYAIGALGLGVFFLWFSFRLALTNLPTDAPESKRFARHLLRASVIYLPLLFALLMLSAGRS